MILRGGRKFFFGGILLIGVFVPLSFGAPRIQLDPPSRQISVDDRAVMTIRLEWPAGEGPYEIHAREPKIENLTLLDHNQSQETGATIVHTLTYVFQPLKNGAAFIHPFEVSYRKSEAEPWEPILIPEQTLQVIPKFPFKAILGVLAMLGGVSLLVVAGIKISRWLKARKALKSIPPPDPKQRIYAQAEEALSTFVSSDTKEKLTYWAAQLRTVVTTYYGVPSKTASSDEILAHLRSQSLQMGEWNEVSRLLGQLNEMQFARQDIPAYELEQIQKSLLQYVRGKIIIENSNS